MQVNQAETSIAFSTQATEPSFSSVWGSEMQREDFLALAAGVRKLSVSQDDIAFIPADRPYSVEHA
ncbi:MAG TPA: hypothetical protein VN798_17450 [Pseudomonas sp.]|jgi:hypothetical protein|uniref:hypothetical protein n=1 Tax=Pseudomonas sp. NPDC087358 TaxID=3364439 RepID=UPI002C084444|nr:hypothetical protein [Pseudomonas sp.]